MSKETFNTVKNLGKAYESVKSDYTENVNKYIAELVNELGSEDENGYHRLVLEDVWGELDEEIEAFTIPEENDPNEEFGGEWVESLTVDNGVVLIHCGCREVYLYDLPMWKLTDFVMYIAECAGDY